MKRPSRDQEREQRISMEIVVDAYTPQEQGRLGGGELADGRLGPGGLQGDQGADADPEDLLGTGSGEDGLEVLDLGADAVVGTVRAGQAAAAPVGQVDGEGLGQGQREPGMAAGRLVAAVQQHRPRAPADPQVADGGCRPWRWPSRWSSQQP